MSDPLLARLAAGEDDAAKELEDFIAKVATPFRADLGAEWEDVVRAATVEVLAELEKRDFEGIHDLRAWVWRLTNRSCIDARRRARRVDWLSLDGESSLSEGSTVTVDFAARDLSLKILGMASAECRELWRRLHLGESYEEMSQALGLTEGALRVRVLRCRRWALSKKRRLGG